MSIICNGVRCIDIKGKSPHTPTPCSPKQAQLFAKLREAEELGLIQRYDGWSDAGAEKGVYNPNLNIPTTWWTDAEAKEYAVQYNKHITTLQMYQRIKLKNYKESLNV